MQGGSTQPTQTTTQNLSPEQTQLLDLAMPNLQKFAASTPQLSQTVAGFNPTQTEGQNQVAGATGTQANIVGSAGDASQYLTSGAALDPNSNPALQATIDASTRPITQNLLESVLPAIRSEAATTGNYGSSRQGIAEGIATGKAAQAVGDTAAKVATSGYQSGLDAEVKALGLAPSTAQAEAIPGATLSSVGDIQQQQSQTEANASDAIANYNQWLPYIQGSSIASLVGGIPGGSTTTVGNVPKPSLFNQLLGTGAVAGSLLSGAGSAATGAANIAPYLAFLSDRRFKTNIEQIGVLFDGTPVYRYFKLGQPEIGIMAQEVEQHSPDAIVDVDGVKHIDVMKATQRAASLGNREAA